MRGRWQSSAVTGNRKQGSGDASGEKKARELEDNEQAETSGVRTWDGADPVAFLETGELFWVMGNDRRRERWLPGFFDREVHEILDGAAELEAERTTEEEEEGKKPLTMKREIHLSVSLHPWEGSKEQGTALSAWEEKWKITLAGSLRKR